MTIKGEMVGTIIIFKSTHLYRWKVKMASGQIYLGGGTSLGQVFEDLANVFD